jgi:hypothetical protein
MKHWLLALSVAAFCVPCPAGAQATVATGPIRHLVYTFTWGVGTDSERNTSGIAESGGAAGTGDMGAPSGMVDSTAGTSDRGTIIVDVLREQPDTGLVVDVSEQARGRRSAPPATCVVFSDTTVICDPNKKVNAEELTLVQYLGVHFVDPDQLDARKHWHVERDGPISTSADYTITKSNGPMLTISETRVVKENDVHAQTTDANATIDYDFTRALPTHVRDYSIERMQAGNNYTTVTSETVLSLQSDSMAVSKN